LILPNGILFREISEIRGLENKPADFTRRNLRTAYDAFLSNRTEVIAGYELCCPNETGN